MINATWAGFWAAVAVLVVAVLVSFFSALAGCYLPAALALLATVGAGAAANVADQLLRIQQAV